MDPTGPLSNLNSQGVLGSLLVLALLAIVFLYLVNRTAMAQLVTQRESFEKNITQLFNERITETKGSAVGLERSTTTLNEFARTIEKHGNNIDRLVMLLDALKQAIELNRDRCREQCTRLETLSQESLRALHINASRVEPAISEIKQEIARITGELKQELRRPMQPRQSSGSPRGGV